MPMENSIFESENTNFTWAKAKSVIEPEKYYRGNEENGAPGLRRVPLQAAQSSQREWGFSIAIKGTFLSRRKGDIFIEGRQRVFRLSRIFWGVSEMLRARVITSKPATHD